MTVLKAYNSNTGQWEPILVGSTGPQGLQGPQGPAGSLADAQTISTIADSYVVSSTDAGKMLTCTKATAMTISIPNGIGLTAGQRVDFLQLGAGQVTFASTGATVSSTPGLKLRAQYSAATLFCVATNVYVLIGDLSA